MDVIQLAGKASLKPLGNFRLSQMARWVRWAALGPLLWSAHSIAGVVTGPAVVTITDNNQPYEQWQVSNGGTLNINDSRAATILATVGSTINLSGATISDSSETSGLLILTSTLNANNSVINGTGVALQISRENTSDPAGGHGTITNSQINGGTTGIQVASSTLVLGDSVVTASAANGVGLLLTQGAATVTNSQITGGLRGISMTRSGIVADSRADLDNTQVEGLAGPAIFVDNRGALTSAINIRNGTTLTGGDGNILELIRSSIVDMTVSNSHLNGNIVLHNRLPGSPAGAALDLAMDSASLTGDISVQENGRLGLGLTNGSQMTGDVNLTGESAAQVSLVGGSQLAGSINIIDASTASLALAGASHMTGDINLADTSSAAINLAEGSQITGALGLAGTSSVTLDLAGASLLTGNIGLADASTATVALTQGSQLAGNINLAGSSTATVGLAGNSQQTGDINLADTASATLDLAQSSRLKGNLSLAGNSITNLSLAGASLMTGDINLADASIADVKLSDASQLAGSVNLAGTGPINLSLTGGSSLLGDINITGVSTATVGLANASQFTGNLEVAAGGTADLTLADASQMSGDVLAEIGSNAQVVLNSNSILTGRLENLTSLDINSGAQWHMVEDSTVANLNINGGLVKFGEAADFQTLNVGTLTGSGTFAMDADFPSGQSDMLNVTESASGNHQLLIASTGADPINDTSLHVVHINSGDATFGLLGGSVDLGTWSYGLRGDGTDWYLDTAHKTISPATGSVLALFNTAPTVWYGELSSLRSRMGELRASPGQSGVWSRAYGAKYNVSGSNGLSYSQQQNGFSLGADAPLPVGDGQWMIGVLAGHSDSDLSLARGSSGNVKSYYAGVYTTWLDAQSGYYFDGVLKFNRFNNDSSVHLSDGTRTKGSYHNNALGASAEFGKHIKFDNGYFVEPSAQVASVVIQGRDYSLDNDMQASGERTRSLLGKLGATAGRRFDFGRGRYAQPYVRAAYVHEFAKGNQVSVNGNSFNNDLAGSRGELGAGVSVAIADRWDVHADLQYTDGEKLSQPWGANVGIRYSW
jgi:outer membrane autotransporter protein